jgi:threonine dehydrogenase-like Zn-dependent dehydrogenase
MTAVNYRGASKVQAEEVPVPQIAHPDDILITVTTSGAGRSFPVSRRPDHLLLH